MAAKRSTTGTAKTAAAGRSTARATEAPGSILINRAPVLTLWAAVVAQRLGHSWDAALTLGKAMAGMNAYTKGVHIGVFEKSEPSKRKTARPRRATVTLLDIPVPVVKTRQGLRAKAGDEPMTPESVERYLESKFGDALPAVRRAMGELARAIPKGDLEERARALYEDFRPEIPRGKRGWGAAGVLDLERIASLAKESRG